MFATTKIRTQSTHVRSLTQPVLFVVLLATVTNTYAASVFDAELELSIKVVTPNIEHKIMVTTSFPRPENQKGIPTGRPNPDNDWNETEIKGGVAAQNPDPFTAERKKVEHGEGLTFHVGGKTHAFKPGDLAHGEGWASGRTRIRLHNFTGLESMPPAESIKVDLDVTAIRALFAMAVAGDASYDWASAKYFYNVTNADTGNVLVSEPSAPVLPIISKEGNSLPSMNRESKKTNVKLNLPAGSFTNIDLFGHVYASGYSEVLPDSPNAVPSERLELLKKRSSQLLPDEKMNLALAHQSEWDPLMGDVVGYGPWAVADVAGVKGNDPLAVEGNDTVFLTQVATDPNQPHDLEISVEVPFDDYTVFTLNNDMIAAGGVHLFGSQLELGTGVGDEFQVYNQIDRARQLQFLLDNSSHDNQLEHTGAFELVNINDPQSPNVLQFQGELSPGQGVQFLTQILVHDGIDGVTDGMARLTLRHNAEGMAGDYTGDYVVDRQDYGLWKETFGSSDLTADGNGNGVIDTGDFTVWQDNFRQDKTWQDKFWHHNFQQDNFPFTDFGGGIHFGASSSAVPEPATVLISLMGLGAVACLTGHRRA